MHFPQRSGAAIAASGTPAIVSRARMLFKRQGFCAAAGKGQSWQRY
jgi:hypothetical protein